MLNIDRINELYRKSKTEGLTEEEKIEQAQLRQAYRDSIRASFTSQMGDPQDWKDARTNQNNPQKK